eukprot:CAMPEP_0202850334 /NCGR_PEP_ID=MMETSP1389-20130828/83427_1 /ASSEMBLY_ACC=CAM_ASM_000865 /TAXON_ID=302021 /ORGANISM="Rhodomonas sp., Strain CCMP768" /LENGTH=69 /DNA_ID=CAMNT_0049528519 /DNA_START=43 /DNA_END=249 /DNA_ORIENTATION=-
MLGMPRGTQSPVLEVPFQQTQRACTALLQTGHSEGVGVMVRRPKLGLAAKRVAVPLGVLNLIYPLLGEL